MATGPLAHAGSAGSGLHTSSLVPAGRLIVAEDRAVGSVGGTVYLQFIRYQGTMEAVMVAGELLPVRALLATCN